MLVIEMLNISHLLTYFLCCSADYTGWSRQFCKMYARLSLRAIWMNSVSESSAAVVSLHFVFFNLTKEKAGLNVKGVMSFWTDSHMFLQALVSCSTNMLACTL